MSKKRIVLKMTISSLLFSWGLEGHSLNLPPSVGASLRPVDRSSELSTADTLLNSDVSMDWNSGLRQDPIAISGVASQRGAIRQQAPRGRSPHETLRIPGQLERPALGDRTFQVGDPVEFRRSSGKINQGVISEIEGELATVVWPEGGQTLQRKVPLSELREIEKITELVKPSRVFEDYTEKIDRLAPLIHSADGNAQHTYISNGYWRQWNNYQVLSSVPVQGWKLHVSGDSTRAFQIVRTLLPFLREAKILHKFAENLTQYKAYENSGHSNDGKLFTLYATSPEQAKYVAHQIDLLLRAQGFLPEHFTTIPGELPVGLGVTARWGRLKGGNLKNLKTGEEIPGSDNQVMDAQGRLYEDQRGTIAPRWVPLPFD